MERQQILSKKAVFKDFTHTLWGEAAQRLRPLKDYYCFITFTPEERTVIEIFNYYITSNAPFFHELNFYLNIEAGHILAPRKNIETKLITSPNTVLPYRATVTHNQTIFLFVQHPLLANVEAYNIQPDDAMIMEDLYFEFYLQGLKKI